MILLAEKLRSTCAVLAAGALLASALAAPAAAVTDRADHTTRLSACVGDAAVDQLFADVSPGHVFSDAIDCIAYYEITQGAGDGSTYSPNQDVTRAEMAVFIARAAEVAGVDLGDVTDAGFTDVTDIWGEAQDAINQLASKGIIASGGAYRPHDAITRAEMATFLIGLLLEAAPDVTKDSSGALLLGVSGSRSVADDYFADANNAEVSALYELGVTTGASAAEVQEAGVPPLDLNYEPDGTVDRGQMAAFITRALAHTSVRPEGVSAQFDGADVIVSVRNAQFRPVSRAVVDVFWATRDQAGLALSSDGTCRLSAVTQSDRSSFPCETDVTDPITGPDGDARVAVNGLLSVPEGGATVWAWTGQNGETLEADADLYSFDVAEGADARYASMTLVTNSLSVRKVRFGGTVIYTVQLRDLVGNVSTGVNGVDPAQWRLSVHVGDEDPQVQTLVSDRTGAAAFTISRSDPTPGTEDGDLRATYRLTGIDNAPPGAATVDATGSPATTGTVIFSDVPSSISSDNATVIIDTRDYVLVSSPFTSISVSVTVLDQYGSPYPGARVDLNDGPDFIVDSRGSHRFTHEYSGSRGEAENLTAGYGVASADEGSETVTVYWVVDAGPNSDGKRRAVLTGDVRSREIVVEDDNGEPLLLEYDDNDRFNLRGLPTTLTIFSAELGEAFNRDSPTGLQLSWSNYLAGSDGRITEYSLS